MDIRDLKRDRELESIILDEFPFPVAGTFQVFTDEREELTLRYRALHWTVYQLMKTVSLVLIGQYLTYEPPEGQEH
ncbi:MAG: hypothetical protein N3B16_10240, partial [Candidatus Aminicenantes bacterium]|nr:hypothetical protein [Candidatus Aminicenantes bacterium]